MNPDRNHHKRTGIAIFFIAISFVSLRYDHPVWGAPNREVGIIIAERVDVQSEPGKHGFLQKRLKKGTRVKVIQRLQGWHIHIGPQLAIGETNDGIDRRA